MCYKIRIYKNTKFNIVNPILTYYRQPVYIEILNCVDPYTGLVSTVNIDCEFKDDVAELMLDDAASLIAGDIENIYQQQRGQASAERNN